MLNDRHGKKPRFEVVYDGKKNLCYTCHKKKPKTDFCIDRSEPTGLQPSCKACINAAKKKYYQKNKEKEQERERERQRLKLAIRKVATMYGVEWEYLRPLRAESRLPSPKDGTPEWERLCKELGESLHNLRHPKPTAEERKAAATFFSDFNENLFKTNPLNSTLKDFVGFSEDQNTGLKLGGAATVENSTLSLPSLNLPKTNE